MRQVLDDGTGAWNFEALQHSSENCFFKSGLHVHKTSQNRSSSSRERTAPITQIGLSPKSDDVCCFPHRGSLPGGET